MIIDCHAHMSAFPVIKRSYGNQPWISIEEYVAVMDEYGIDKAVVLPLAYAEFSPYSQNFGEILHICQQHPDRFIPFCSLDPRLPMREDLVTVDDMLFFLRQFKELGAKGLGELVVRLPWNEPRMLKLLEACEIVGLPILFHTTTPDNNGYGVIDYPGLELLEYVLKKFPKLCFFGHSQGFWSEIGGELKAADKNGYPEGPVKEGGAVVRLMREYPNLYGDISAGSGMNALRRDPEFSWKFIDEFQDRLLLGLDYCVAGNKVYQIDWLKQAKKDGNITADVYEKIMWKNLNAALDLGLQE